ncbi:hypothetical protein B0T12DRAFT_194727 [Alternaria alternata]|nr:hypothetical protein B0T12DRAFT_194727 [Alternaria alternata]
MELSRAASGRGCAWWRRLGNASSRVGVRFSIADNSHGTLPTDLFFFSYVLLATRSKRVAKMQRTRWLIVGLTRRKARRICGYLRWAWFPCGQTMEA